ncbi:MAG TPA: hypothetical protein PKE52_02820, partial [Bacteroidales bacterium]|nr:hypothetical protein [Bacteroidales bacterium]
AIVTEMVKSHSPSFVYTNIQLPSADAPFVTITLVQEYPIDRMERNRMVKSIRIILFGLRLYFYLLKISVLFLVLLFVKVRDLL